MVYRREIFLENAINNGYRQYIKDVAENSFTIIIFRYVHRLLKSPTKSTIMNV